MSQKQGESKCLHFPVDLVAKSIAAKFLWSNFARLVVHSQGMLELQSVEHGMEWHCNRLGILSIILRCSSIPTSILTSHSLI